MVGIWYWLSTLGVEVGVEQVEYLGVWERFGWHLGEGGGGENPPMEKKGGEKQS